MGILTTSVGSFPKPRELRRARGLFAEEQIEAAVLAEAEARATEEVVRLQESLGLDLLVDGQMDRGDMVTFFAERLEGLEIAGLVRCFGNRYYKRPRVIGDVVRTGPIAVDGWKAAQALTSRPVKAVLTGPYTMMDWSYDEHYNTRDRCCFAFAEAIRVEAEALVAAGAREIQIDEPAAASRPDELDMVAEALARVVKNLDGKARTWIYVAYGDHASAMPELLRLPGDALMLELANSELAVLDQLAEFPADKLLAAGVIDPLDPTVESADLVEDRLRRLLAVVPAERLWATPDAGLRTLTLDQSRAKLHSLVTAAARF